MCPAGVCVVSYAVLGGDGSLIASAEESGIGLSVNSFYAGGFLHADDIRALASSVSSKEEQVAMVQKFVRENLLKLNAQKCEIVVFLRNQTKQFPECSIDGEVITAVLDVHFGTPRILFQISS